MNRLLLVCVADAKNGSISVLKAIIGGRNSTSSKIMATKEEQILDGSAVDSVFDVKDSTKTMKVFSTSGGGV